MSLWLCSCIPNGLPNLSSHRPTPGAQHRYRKHCITLTQLLDMLASWHYEECCLLYLGNLQQLHNPRSLTFDFINNYCQNWNEWIKWIKLFSEERSEARILFVILLLNSSHPKQTDFSYGPSPAYYDF